MKILVCIKQVPDMESKFKIDAAGTWYDNADLAWRMNEYDEYAVEQAVQLKEQVGEGDITVLCIGSDKVKETMKKALAMGCDRGVHVSDEAVSSKEPFQIASIIAAFAGDKGFDLIFTGMQSQDRGSGQVGVLVLEDQLAQAVLGVGRQLDLAVPGQLDERAQAERAVQVNVQVGLGELGDERLVRAPEVLCLHAQGLRLGFRLDRLIQAHVPFLAQHGLGHHVTEGRSRRELGRAVQRLLLQRLRRT